MNMMQPRPRAFISCSLREEDRPFVDYIEWIVMMCGFEPFGTVGRYSAAPIPICQHMDEGIKQADCLVLVATPRYLSQDIHERQKTGRCMSEMLHVEVGMAYVLGKPVIAFVQEGTDVGGFIPQVTQYISLRYDDRQQLESKSHLINDCFYRALSTILESNKKRENADIGKVIGWALAFYGGFTLLDKYFSQK